MDDPEAQFTGIVKALTEGPNKDQTDTLNDYFLRDAFFTHPFCRVPSFKNYRVPFTSWIIDSRWVVLMIYRWYHVLSPEIKLEVDSISFDKPNNLLYATMRQVFTIWFVPFSLWQAHVKLVTVLTLAHLPVDEEGRIILPPPPPPQHDDLHQHGQCQFGDEQCQFDADQHFHHQQYEDDHALAPHKHYFIQGQEDHYQPEEWLKFIAPWGASMLWMAWQLFASLVCVVGVRVVWPVFAPLRDRVFVYWNNDGSANGADGQSSAQKKGV
ncbi:Uu.00g017620.m01.CDS01 [Anthostomella pinea]|uniref:Uu.00g017620.m01.CDS01 n=1 Tax=Anthostomella pinea TaxID=933095 RepID=A0AAI8VYY2_9PEZI|nr:Uu.00g017620.m01.CDS01 [Anthostomella pinea]